MAMFTPIRLTLTYECDMSQLTKLIETLRDTGVLASFDLSLGDSVPEVITTTPCPECEARERIAMCTECHHDKSSHTSPGGCIWCECMQPSVVSV